MTRSAAKREMAVPDPLKAMLSFDIERALHVRGYGFVAGVDEVGRGPLAGPVAAAAVILDPAAIPPGLADSKTLAAGDREHAYRAILSDAVAVGVGFATAREIDAVNIRQATFLAMRRALTALHVGPHYIVVDGRDVPPGWTGPAEAIVRGDGLCASIAAASIVAKVTRDRLMVRQHQRDPRYGFDRHKGYATRDHRSALAEHGPSPLHRLSFAPCVSDVDEAVPEDGETIS